MLRVGLQWLKEDKLGVWVAGLGGWVGGWVGGCVAGWVGWVEWVGWVIILYCTDIQTVTDRQTDVLGIRRENC